MSNERRTKHHQLSALFVNYHQILHMQSNLKLIPQLITLHTKQPNVPSIRRVNWRRWKCEWSLYIQVVCVRCGSKTGHQKDMCLTKIKLHVHNVLTILGSVVYIIGRNVMINKLWRGSWLWVWISSYELWKPWWKWLQAHDLDSLTILH